MKIDFTNHVALVAVAQEDGKPTIVGGGRYVVFEPQRAEMAFVVVDAWQGRGIGSMLMRHLIKIAGDAGLNGIDGGSSARERSDAEGVRKVRIQASCRTRDPQTVHLVLELG